MGLTMHRPGHRTLAARLMLIQEPAPPDKEAPGPGLRYELPSNGAGLSYSLCLS